MKSIWIYKKYKQAIVPCGVVYVPNIPFLSIFQQNYHNSRDLPSTNKTLEGIILIKLTWKKNLIKYKDIDGIVLIGV